MVNGRDAAPMAMGLTYSDDLFMNTVLIGAPINLAWEMAVQDFLNDVDSYNIHFYQHLSQAWAVVGIGHPGERIRQRAWDLYVRMAGEFHWLPETVFEFRHRLKDGIRKPANALPSDDRPRDPLRNNPVVGGMSEKQAQGILEEMRQNKE